MTSSGSIDRDFLLANPLPEINVSAGKDERGAVLIIGGSSEIPGAVLLAAEAALRAGAGKLQIATVSSVAPQLAVAIPEARVIALAENSDGEIDPASSSRLTAEVRHANAILVGPGMVDEPGARALSLALLEIEGDAPFVFDAAALTSLKSEATALQRCGRDFALTPHPGEMAAFNNTSKEEIIGNPLDAGAKAAAHVGGVVVMKGPTTFICSPEGRTWRCEGGGLGMATSGSGDVLAGLITGVAARGAPLLLAAQWGVFVHAEAGRRLALSVGKAGYLARELAVEVPRIIDELRP
ncbi:NAD(P)H-hydrate dehydratase [Aurantimonas endophytica]|uniref:ADP-dependent (S)-NAD(P)H-hydrate dehydratase n=1 Tax=Aurantimonas endophytica TaxID=1522175 RepID=A0A7W6HGG4_9HYPH|nr:NAD(P)H-hydrate dehydratase [Aurantimonas endophytica]MBB4004702.1 hydroxyethylthiazole kinase-like uncharacterized protein yjeF [Aurantimonas endophytica]MCO6405518.1 NAD(P)H-hydrate dehydratase [Aurantimonas endophytica]